MYFLSDVDRWTYLHTKTRFTLVAATFGVGICRAQPAQPGPSASTDSAKPLLLERNEGELRVRRKQDNVIPASTSISHAESHPEE
jgi:hypothetical protein